MAASPMEKPDLYVLVRIMERLHKADGPMLRTHLQVASNLNYDVFSKYIEWMAGKELVCYSPVEESKEGIRLTPKGEAAYSSMVTWMSQFIMGR
jgi:predicted transcriptional regulator